MWLEALESINHDEGKREIDKAREGNQPEIPNEVKANAMEALIMSRICFGVKNIDREQLVSLSAACAWRAGLL